MSTFLFDRIVFGPIRSRRLGASLGVNLLPIDCKFCNFDCIYCECGRNTADKTGKLPAREDVYGALEHKLAELQQRGIPPDTITFAGNGEPTMHPAFAGIVDDTVSLRNRYAPASKISVLTNATMLHRPEIVTALKKTDQPILKLDSAFDSTIALLNQPVRKISVSALVEQFQSFAGQCIIQTMFVQGACNGLAIDNTAPEELDAWEKAVLAIMPVRVMIYTIARDTPTDTLHKISEQILLKIARRMERHGIRTHVSG